MDSNGSIVMVRLKRQGVGWLGPRGEYYPTLPSSEQFQIGGFNTVRGYPQGEFLGDYGALLRTELSFPIYGMPKDWRLPYQKKSLYDVTRLVGFYDVGTAHLRGALPGEASEKDIAGAGVGIRMRLFDRLNAQVGWGVPLTEQPSDGSENALYVGLSMDVV